MKNLLLLFKLTRPTQWTKNGFVFMPLVFSGRLFIWEDVAPTLWMLVAFCLGSSAVYIINDYMDMDQDRVHPLKKNRPLASGAIQPGYALILAVALIILMFLAGMMAKAPSMGMLALGMYIVLHTLYSWKLKDFVIIDVLVISAGFLLRVLAGTSVLMVGMSSWLVLCTFSISIFLALGKRRHEVVMLSCDAACHRPVLENYSVTLLDQLLQVVTTATFIFYCLYSVKGHLSGGQQSESMMYTIPFVTYGIFRYMFLIYHREDGGSPSALLLTDPPLLICVILWLISCIGILYF
jgi:4-hydroxybenzoate polyprenyltransferase